MGQSKRRTTQKVTPTPVLTDPRLGFYIPERARALRASHQYAFVNLALYMCQDKPSACALPMHK